LPRAPEAVLSHRSAAALWGLRSYSEGAVHVTVSHKSTSSRLIRRHVSHLPEDARTVEEGIAVTSVPRTILDLAGAEPADAVVSLLREAEYREKWDRLSLWDLLERYPGRRGVRKVRWALERLKSEPPGRRRSRLEERFAPFLRHHHLPQPRFNDWILLGAKRFQVDCHWPGSGQIVELDGWEGTRHQERPPRRPRQGPRLARRRLLGHPSHLEPARRRTARDRRRPPSPARDRPLSAEPSGITRGPSK
jgi:hypothetical protein